MFTEQKSNLQYQPRGRLRLHNLSMGLHKIQVISARYAGKAVGLLISPFAPLEKESVDRVLALYLPQLKSDQIHALDSR